MSNDLKFGIFTRFIDFFLLCLEYPKGYGLRRLLEPRLVTCVANRSRFLHSLFVHRAYRHPRVFSTINVAYVTTHMRIQRTLLNALSARKSVSVVAIRLKRCRIATGRAK